MNKVLLLTLVVAMIFSMVVGQGTGTGGGAGGGAGTGANMGFNIGSKLVTFCLGMMRWLILCVFQPKLEQEVEQVELQVEEGKQPPNGRLGNSNDSYRQNVDKFHLCLSLNKDCDEQSFVKTGIAVVQL